MREKIGERAWTWLKSQEYDPSYQDDMKYAVIYGNLVGDRVTMFTVGF